MSLADFLLELDLEELLPINPGGLMGKEDSIKLDFGDSQRMRAYGSSSGTNQPRKMANIVRVDDLGQQGAIGLKGQNVRLVRSSSPPATGSMRRSLCPRGWISQLPNLCRWNRGAIVNAPGGSVAAVA